MFNILKSMLEITTVALYGIGWLFWQILTQAIKHTAITAIFTLVIVYVVDKLI